MTAKLFIGQIPTHITEEELRPIFQEYGNIVELIVLRDRHTHAHKGCAFVTYASKAEADACIEALHNKYTLPNMINAVQIKYAGSEQAQSSADIKLFIGLIPKTATVEELLPIFAPFGEIEELSILKGPDGHSKGCAFLRYKTRDAAVSAVTKLNGSMRAPGASTNLVVKFAESDKDKKKAPPRGNQSLVSNDSYYQQLQQLQQIAASNPVLSLVLDHITSASGGSAGLGGMGSGFGNMGGYGANSFGSYGGGAGSSSGGDGPAGSNKEGPPGANLFVYHLPTNYNDMDMYDSFCQFGNVLSAKVFMDRETNTSRCFGFVSFDTPEAAQVAIQQMNGAQIGQKRLKVQLKAAQSKGRSSRPY